MPSEPQPLKRNKSGTESNPLKFDSGLRNMIAEVENITKHYKFQRWKGSFLERFEQFLLKPGIEQAQEAHLEFKAGMDVISRHVDNVETFVKKGDLTNEKVTVKGRNSLNEMCMELAKYCDETAALIPATSAEERKRGYNKYMVGAVLVRDGFTEYDRMKHLSDVLVYLSSEHLTEVADKQQHELFVTYANQFKKFCEIMEDLGLYEGKQVFLSFFMTVVHSWPPVSEDLNLISNVRCSCMTNHCRSDACLPSIRPRTRL